MTNLLWLSSLRYLSRHRWLLLLSVIGVALGVAIVVAIDLANGSARTAFALSSETVAGRATHRIVGGSTGLSDSVYVNLRTSVGFERSAPVVEGYVSTPRDPGRTLQVLGVDPFAEGPFRPYVARDARDEGTSLDLAAFLSASRTAVMSASTAEALGVTMGNTLVLDIEGATDAVEIVGLIQPANNRSAAAIENLLLTDISTAQDLFSARGRLSHVDLILEAGELEQLTRGLPEGVEIVRASSRSETLSQMTRAFELNLSALSLLALVVGMFLTYNTMNFSVVQRRPLIGRMRALGVTRREVLALVLSEALVVGVIGTALGLLLGLLLGRGLVHLVTRTINDLYYVVSVRSLDVRPLTLVKGTLLGLGATLVSAWMPARSATNAPASTVLQRSSEESRIRSLSPWLALAGVLAGIVGAAMLSLPSRSIALSYAALFLVLAGFALIVPATIIVLVRLVRPGMDRAFGAVGRMAASGISATLSRTSVAIAALMIAVAATIGVGVMVSSFRTTVVSWLTNALQADIYIQPPNLVFRSGAAEIRPGLVETMRAADGVAESYGVRHVQVSTSAGPSQLSAVEPAGNRESSLVIKGGNASDVLARFRNEGEVMVSESYAYRNRLGRGDTLRILTDRGELPFRIAGVYFDYASDQGVVLIARETYNRAFDDRAYSGLALFVAPGENREAVMQRIRAAVSTEQELIIRSNRDLREYSLEIFDRTFTITMVLRLLAVLVAFVGVVSALMALQIERANEYRVLKAVGLTRRQQRRMIMTQTGLMGAFAGLLSIPLGLILAWVLIFVINRRSFGWTLQFTADAAILGQALAVSVGAALLAGAAALWFLTSRDEVAT